MRSDLPPWAYAMAVKSGALYQRLVLMLRDRWADVATEPAWLYPTDPLEWRVSK